MKPTQALRTLAGAIDAGQLPDDTILRMTGSVVEVTLPGTYYRRSFADHDQWADKVRHMYPGGSDRRLHVSHRGDKRRRILASDRADYRVTVGDVLIVMEYVIPHEHQHYRGEVVNGKPKWVCVGCRQPITITEARRLGLLPPRTANHKGQK